MGMEMDFRIAQMPSNVRVGDPFGDGQEHDQRKQYSQQDRETEQLPKHLRAPPKHRFFFGSNYARNHGNG
jgi:hypothetical protein